MTLSVERLVLAQNSDAAISCNINSALNCSSVMKSWQAELVGVPNPFFGLIGFAITLAFGLVLAFRKDLGKWLNLGALAGSFGAFLFSYWLLYQSAYSIGALCIYCLISCTSATNIFFAFLLINLKENTLELGQKVHSKIQGFIDKNYFWIPIALWYLLIIGLVIAEFQETLIG